MSNLANIYEKLLRKYGDNYTIKFTKPTTYLSTLANENFGKVIFLCKEERNAYNFTSPSKLNIQKSKDQADLDLTGSPLKDDCKVEVLDDDLTLDIKLVAQNPWKIDEECHRAIGGVEKARALICTDEFQSVKGAAEAHGSVWILCNGDDAEKTIFLEYEFLPGYFSRGIITYLGVSPTTVSCQSLVRSHYCMINKGAPIETTIENTYNIKSGLALRCQWITTAALPALIDLSSCDVTLTQSFYASQCNVLTQDFMNQLHILKYIRDDILAYKETEMNDSAKEVIYRCGRGIEMEDLRERINKVMTEISGFSEIDVAGNAEADIEAVLQRAKLRQLSDLTDKLWDILKCCSSFKDLKQAFNILFQCAARCNIVNTPTNKNRLAEIITEIANRRLAIPCLSGSEPLELLLEIGLEKLYKDYEFIFTESKICSANDLKIKSSAEMNRESDENVVPNVRKSLRNAVRPDVTASARKTLLHNNIRAGTNNLKNSDIGFKNSNFVEHETNTQLAKLLQIHCTLEHLLMLHINLNLSHVYSDVCEQLLRRSLRYVDTIDENFVDKMVIALAPHEIREHLQGKDPFSRRIIMKSMNKFRKVQSTYFYSMENVCPAGISECFQTEDKELVKENIYYAWLYRKITTLKK